MHRMDLLNKLKERTWKDTIVPVSLIVKNLLKAQENMIVPLKQ